MSRFVKVIGHVMVGLVVAGCNGDVLAGLPDSHTPPGLVFEVTETRWGRGDTILVLLGNESDEPLGYNLCVAGLERLTAGAWQPVQQLPDNVFCTLELRVLEPAESAYGRQVVYSFIEPGAYRFHTTVEWPLGHGTVAVISNGFRIVGP